jgi:DDE family transposase
LQKSLAQHLVSRAQFDYRKPHRAQSQVFVYTCMTDRIRIALFPRAVANQADTGNSWQRHGDACATGRGTRRGKRVAAMRTALARSARRSRYRLRKQTVEPVFGEIKQARGFRQLLLRGIEKVRGEWSLICTVHNLLKLAKAMRTR